MNILRGLALIFITFGMADVRSDIALEAPGLEVPLSATSVPFQETYILSEVYKFVFLGIGAKGDTLGAPGNSGTDGNGGQFHLSATVSMSNSTKVKVGKLEFLDVPDFNVSVWQTLLLANEIVFKATTVPISVYLKWDGQGNAHKPNGCFHILGEYQKHPPVPVGSIHLSSGNWILMESGAIPDGEAKITRE